jgi:PqqD family protein of HPr-rel-A system
MSGPSYIADIAAGSAIDLEGLSFVFHERSGMTHILAPPSPEILFLLQEAPADAAGLVERLRERFDLPEGAEELVGVRLEELHAAGLVRKA